MKTTAIKRYQADLQKYVGITVVPDDDMYAGYITAGLAVLGLPGAGKDFARQGVVDAIRSDGGYKYPAKHGRYYLNVKNGEFVVLNRVKPIVGNLVGEPAALAANAAGETPPSR